MATTDTLPHLTHDGLPPIPWYEGYIAAATGFGTKAGCGYDMGTSQYSQWWNGQTTFRKDQLLGAIRATELAASPV